MKSSLFAGKNSLINLKYYKYSLKYRVNQKMLLILQIERKVNVYEKEVGNIFGYSDVVYDRVLYRGRG